MPVRLDQLNPELIEWGGCNHLDGLLYVIFKKKQRCLVRHTLDMNYVLLLITCANEFTVTIVASLAHAM